MCTWILATTLLLNDVGPQEGEGTAPAAASGQLEKERATDALELCRKGANEYRLFVDDGPELELKTEPVLRWSNPSVGSIHGVVFVWTNRGRPAAIASISAERKRRTRSGSSRIISPRVDTPVEA